MTIVAVGRQRKGSRKSAPALNGIVATPARQTSVCESLHAPKAASVRFLQRYSACESWPKRAVCETTVSLERAAGGNDVVLDDIAKHEGVLPIERLGHGMHCQGENAKFREAWSRRTPFDRRSAECDALTDDGQRKFSIS